MHVHVLRHASTSVDTFRQRHDSLYSTLIAKTSQYYVCTMKTLFPNVKLKMMVFLLIFPILENSQEATAADAYIIYNSN